MMRINLLPPEILERRKAEKRIIWVVMGAIGMSVVLAGVWGFGYWRLQGKQDELASLQQMVQSTNAQAAQLAIFEERAVELEARRLTVVRALGDRRDWARLLDEISLVMPADMWVQTMTVDELGGLTLNGYALDSPADVPDVGHKAIAKALVRLADLEGLYDVWLTNSSKTMFLEQPAIQFSITAKVVVPVPAGTTPTVTQTSGAGGQ